MTRTHPIRHLGRVFAIAAAAAMLVSGVPAASSATSAAACKVTNTATGAVRGNLQRAIRAASPGDRLVVQGTCTGTTIIDRDVTIGGRRIASSSMVCDQNGCRRTGVRDSGPPTLKSGSRRPALIIEPRVDGLRIAKRVVVRPGLVVGDAGAWAPAWWAAPSGSVPPLRRSSCRVMNVGTIQSYGALPPAVREASAGDRLMLLGRCRRASHVHDDLGIYGVRVATDKPRPSISAPRRGVALTVDASVDQFVLRGVELRGGLRIR